MSADSQNEVAVVVNLRARRGSEAIARRCEALLPGARVLASRSMDDTLSFARRLHESPVDLVVAAGGDGTAAALLNAFRRATPAGRKVTLLPTGSERAALGVVPLGTGNGWARATGAPRWRKAIRRLGEFLQANRPIPIWRFDLLDIEDFVAPFAGTGWDAEIIDDFHAQKSGWGLLPHKARTGLFGYLHGVATRTIPRHMRMAAPEVELVNTGDDAFTIDDDGRMVKLLGGEHGKVLYRGPFSVCAAGTTPEWGFGFRAFPFAGLVPRRFCMRIYKGKALEAAFRAPQLWVGQHPMRNMHTWMLTSCRASFSRPVPFQVAGDRIGMRDTVEYKLASEQVNMLDWSHLRAGSLDDAA